MIENCEYVWVYTFKGGMPSVIILKFAITSQLTAQENRLSAKDNKIVNMLN